MNTVLPSQSSNMADLENELASSVTDIQANEVEQTLDMSKFLMSGSSKGGVDSGRNNINPPKPSLMFITTMVNKHKTEILIDTGATTTFVNEKALFRMIPSRSVHKQSCSFVLTDGLASFEVVGVIYLTIEFAESITEIQACVARNLCTDMIIGMNYINKYNLSIDVKRQTVSVDNQNRTFTMSHRQEFWVN